MEGLGAAAAADGQFTAPSGHTFLVAPFTAQIIATLEEEALRTFKREKEGVFKLKDELPDAMRYALMAWPELPDPAQPSMTDEEARRWNAFDDKTRSELTRRRLMKQQESTVIEPGSRDYPLGDFYQHDGDSDRWDDPSVMY